MKYKDFGTFNKLWMGFEQRMEEHTFGREIDKNFDDLIEIYTDAKHYFKLIMKILEEMIDCNHLGDIIMRDILNDLLLKVF